MLSMLKSAQKTGAPFTLLVSGLTTREYSEKQVSDILDEIRQIDDLPVLLLVGTETNNLCAEETVFRDTRIISKPPRSDRMLRTVCQLLTGDGTAPVPRPSDSGLEDAADLAGLNVLVAEDNRFNQEFLATILGDMDIIVTMAANGEEACQHASETVYDLIFMDIHMPVKTGKRPLLH